MFYVYTYTLLPTATIFVKVLYLESPCIVACKMTNVVNSRCMVASDQISVHLKEVTPSSNRHVMLLIVTTEAEREEGWAQSRVSGQSRSP
jgi:hypothetical protein